MLLTTRGGFPTTGTLHFYSSFSSLHIGTHCNMMTKNNNCLTKKNAESNDDDDFLLPKMYSTLDEIDRHLRCITDSSTTTASSAADATKDSCDTSSSATYGHEHEHANNLPHLFLHFDVNETILLGDPAGGDSVHECVNKIIAKSAFVSTSGIHCHENDSDNLLNDPAKPTIKRSPSSGNICDTHQFEPTHWWNGMSIDNYCNSAPPPPLYSGWTYPPNTCPYYRTRYKVHAKKFTSSLHGQVYRPLYDELCQKLGLKNCARDDDDDSGGGSDLQQQQQPSSVFQNFLPAFWQTLMYYFPSTKTELSNNESAPFLAAAAGLLGTECRRLPPPPKVTLVLRTFGLDLPRVAVAISEFAKGNHPEYPNYSNEDLILAEGDLYCSGWSYHNKNGNDAKEEELVYSLHRANTNQEEKGTAVYSGDDDILNFLQSKSIIGIQDNYPFWRENKHAPWAGKPVWTNTRVHGHDHHHVLLDDNIHNDPSDGAGSIRVPVVVEKDGSSNNYNRYESLHGEEALALHGRHLIRVPTIRPSLEDDWFIRQIEKARWLELDKY